LLGLPLHFSNVFKNVSYTLNANHLSQSLAVH
jgi:hypothetical protein